MYWTTLGLWVSFWIFSIPSEMKRWSENSCKMWTHISHRPFWCSLGYSICSPFSKGFWSFCFYRKGCVFCGYLEVVNKQYPRCSSGCLVYLLLGTSCHYFQKRMNYYVLICAWFRNAVGHYNKKFHCDDHLLTTSAVYYSSCTMKLKLYRMKTGAESKITFLNVWSSFNYLGTPWYQGTSLSDQMMS